MIKGFKEKVAGLLVRNRGLVKVLSLFFFSSFTASLLGQNPAETEQIRKARNASNEALAKGDLAAYAATITSDFVITLGNGGTSTHDTLLKTLETSFADVTAARCVRTPEQIKLSTSRPIAAEQGHWECRSLRPDGTLIATGVYMAMWRQDAGTWRTRSELFVTLACTGSSDCAPTKP